jgi:ribosomal peptide maturation radical SAM protein 1
VKEPVVPGTRTPDRADLTARAAWPTVIVAMPFLDSEQPSIQLGLLKAVAEGYGFPVRTLHANLDFAARLGVDEYRGLCEHRGRLVGDWLFSVAAFGDAAPDPDGRMVEDLADELAYLGGSPQERRERLLRIRDEDVPAYLDALVDTGWDGVRVVGFSSVFQQNAAAFALARRLKQRYPDIVTVFGGANFEGEMGLELVRSIDCVDIAVTGEGDVAFPRLLCALAAGEDPDGIPGVARRVGDRVVATPPAPPLNRLDDLPVPDYEEYFERAQRLGLLPAAGHRTTWVPFESARGCWWGEKHHCTFCGLNGSTMKYRSKSPQRVFAELAELARRYRSFRFQAVDNILDMGYLTELFPALTASGTDYEMFYEVKANLTRAQLRMMAQAGVVAVQPGLESLSSPVLRLMRKGVRAAQNVNVLRWGQYYNLHVSWNVIWGFPGETEQQYKEQADWIPHLVHLRPPIAALRIWMERFSPLYMRQDEFGVRACVPERSYRYVYPGGVDLDRVAYFFEHEIADALPDSTYLPLKQAIDGWKAAWESDERPVLKYWSAPGYLQIYDGRHPGKEGTYTFEGVLADVYLACSDRPTTASAVRDRLGQKLPVAAVQEAIEEFAQRGLMFLDESLAVALAIPAVAGR